MVKIMRRSYGVRCVILVTLLFIYLCYLYEAFFVKIIEKKPGVIYMLQYTGDKTEPFSFMGQGSKAFEIRQCRVANCYVTADRSLLGDIRNFDVLLFHTKEFLKNGLTSRPYRRTGKQKYVFASMESSANYPVRIADVNEYFNMTWTYKLDSDVFFGYIAIRDKIKTIIGPRKEMHWMNIDDMLPIDDTIQSKIENKKKAAAWFVSNCYSLNDRLAVADQIAKALEPFGLTVDIYGNCGTKKCHRSSKGCSEMIQNDYFFYFAFENSNCEDYVTEKLLTGLKNYAVPVVYGGANYTRFMPDGIYLDVSKLGIQGVVNKMVEAILDKNIYSKYFKWHNHYSYHDIDESPDTSPYCSLCEYVHKMYNQTKVYNISGWWDPSHDTLQTLTK